MLTQTVGLPPQRPCAHNSGHQAPGSWHSKSNSVKHSPNPMPAANGHPQTLHPHAPQDLKHYQGKCHKGVALEL